MNSANDAAMTALVLDGDQRPALAIVRSLGRRGISVVVGADRPGSLASSSRYCARRVGYPSPEHDVEAFQRFLLEFVGRERIDVVIPVTDVTTHAVSLNQDALRRRTAVAVPPFASFEEATNKWAILQRAARCGVPVPRSLVVEGIAGLKGVAADIEYPVVIKPVQSRIPAGRGWLRAGVQYAGCESDLWRAYEETDYLAAYPSLVQQRIVGPGVGVFALFDRGRLLVTFAHRRLREKPPSGGVSVLCESVRMEARLEEYASRLLGPLGWHGVAMLEFKEDLDTGELFLMEVNGRFWGSLQLSVDAGVDFPYLTWQLALGHRPAAAETYRAGVRSRWLLGDLDHLLLRLFRDDRSLHLPEGAPSRFRALREFLRFTGRNLHYDTASAADPFPFAGEVREYAKALLTSAMDRVSRTRGPRVRAPRVSPVLDSNITERS